MNYVTKIAALVAMQTNLTRDLDNIKGHIKHLRPGFASGEIEAFEVKLETRWTAPIKFTVKDQPLLGLAMFEAAEAILDSNLRAVNKELATMELILESNVKEGPEG
jgi:hypothetical protein